MVTIPRLEGAGPQSGRGAAGRGSLESAPDYEFALTIVEIHNRPYIALTMSNRMSTSKLHDLSDLSELQKKLLETALQAHFQAPLRVAFDAKNPGCFGIKPMMRKIPDRKERARRRSAAGLSIARLIKRGLLESCSRGKWRVTRAGLAVARKLWPELKPMSKKKVERTVAQTNARTAALRDAIHAAMPGLGSRRRRKPRAIGFGRTSGPQASGHHDEEDDSGAATLGPQSR
jgi:hypothetical protein